MIKNFSQIIQLRSVKELVIFLTLIDCIKQYVVLWKLFLQYVVLWKLFYMIHTFRIKYRIR